jgi:hypothetical protein
MTIRELIIDWLTASRYVKWLEARHIEQRQDYTSHLAEKDNQIKHLRIELATVRYECDRMRTMLMPLPGEAQVKMQQASPIPSVPAFNGISMDDWQAELNKLYMEEIDGIHEQKADDAA